MEEERQPLITRNNQNRSILKKSKIFALSIFLVNLACCVFNIYLTRELKCVLDVSGPFDYGIVMGWIILLEFIVMLNETLSLTTSNVAEEWQIFEGIVLVLEIVAIVIGNTAILVSNS